MYIYLGTLIQDPGLVVEAAALTAAVTFLLTIYAIVTKNDFTVLFTFVFILILMLIACFIGFLFDNNSFGINVLVDVLVVLIYSIYLIVDTQLILGGHRIQLSIDDYIIGAIILYVDIIVLFIRILIILASLKK